MNNLQYLGCITLLGVLASASTAMAQTPAPIFTPRLGVRYTTEGGGYESFSSFEGFLPVFQTPGNSLTFLQGKVLLDNDSNLGTNILLGHRIFSAEGNRVVGGYIAYSTRDTGKSNFNQLGLGFETLGNWDFRFNAYLPLGTSENQVSVINTGSGFQGNSFLLGRQRSFEVAMSGVDAEIGTRLLRLGAGDLRGFVGAYYYSGGESKEAFGWRTRVEARPTDFLNFGLSLQHDELFDTRLVFTIGANFPGSSGRGTKPKKDSALLRMAESSDRQSAILVTHERRNDTVVATGTDNQPLTIIYVTNNGTGNGTFESPLGSITNAVGIAKANNIIYVLADTPTTIAPFIIPDGVQVLSSASVQTVNTQQFGLVTLPLSGNGIYPVITGSVTGGNGLVTLGNNTVLSGFDIQVQGNDDARGIKGTNISNVRILDNKITNAFSEGIYLENVTGIVEIARNTITDTRNPLTDTSLESGIFVWNYQGDTNLTITDNRIVTNFNAEDYRIDGIEVNLCRDVDELFVSKTCASNASITATITNNEIIHNGKIVGGADGIDINLGNLGKGTFTISNNTLTNIPDEGISINAVANSEGNFTITNNIIQNIGDRGIQLAATDNAIIRPTITNNTITNVTGDGINLSQVTDATVTNNNINNISSDGIKIENASGNNNISSNTISDVSNDGIDLDNVTNANVSNNNISNVGDDGIDLNNVTNANVTNNNISNAGDDGIEIENTSGNNNISSNTISNVSDDGIDLDNVTNANVTNNNITSAGDNGIKIENASGNNNISSNTISNVSDDGIDLNNVTNANVTNNNISNAGDDGIEIENASGNNNISSNTISNVSDDGIDLDDVTNAQVTNNNITNAGEQGIQVENAHGTINIDSNIITDAQQESISLSEVTGTVSVSQNIVNGNNNNNNNGIAIANTSGTTNLTVNSNQLTENFNDIRVSLSDTTGTLQINDNTITNNGTAIDVQLGANTNLTSVSLNNNQITGVDADVISSGINFQAFDAAAGNVTASGNTINTITNGDGMNFQLNGTSTATFQIANNIISNIRDTDTGDFNFTEAINFEIFDDAKADVTITNNNISQIPTGSGVYMQFDGGDNAGNIAITDNTISQITTAGNGIDLQFVDNFATTNINAIVDVSGNTIFDIKGIGINAFNETSDNTVNLTANNNSITNTSGDGINLNGVNNAQVTNNNITNAGEQGIQVENAHGTINVDSNTITDAQQESISLLEVTGTVSVSQNIINGNNNNNGIAIANTSGTTNLTVNSNQLTENFNYIRVSLSDTTGTLQINDNTITNNGTAIDVQLGANTNLTSVSLNNNQITGVDADVTSSGINFQAFDAAAGNVTASGNTINTITNGDGMNFQLNGTSTATFQIANNIISNIRDTDTGDFNFTDGINLEAFDSATTTFNVSNNTISQIQSGNGVSGLSFNNANTEFNISNNLIEQLEQGTGVFIGLLDDQDGVFSVAKIQLTNNIIDQIKGSAITFSNGASNELTTTVTITGNQVTNVTP
jgi:parallel beta-helix repeat protein